MKWLTRLAARHMGKHSWDNRETAHERMLQRTRQMRAELGLGDDRRLRA